MRPVLPCWAAAALLCAGSGAAAQSAAGPTAADTAWKTHLRQFTGGSGIFIASNAEYRTAENGEPPAYGQRYWMGFGGTTMHGCLWGQYADRAPVYWQFFVAWDPPRRKLLVHQESANGMIGIGWEDVATGIADQEFTRPDGARWFDRHLSRFAGGDTLVTVSYDRATADAEWKQRRTYRWVRQAAGAKAPC